MESSTSVQYLKRSGSRRFRLRRSRKTPPGAAPGAGVGSVASDAPKPIIRLVAYDGDHMDVLETGIIEDVRSFRQTYTGRTIWIEIRGFGDRTFLDALAEDFKIHRLELEDVVNTYQRPKVEESEEHLFIISRPVFHLGTNDEEPADDQVSLFLGKEFIISFQERPQEYFATVFERLSQNKGLIRKSGSDYLAYALMDAVVDNYFPTMEKLGNYLDDLEDMLLDRPDVNSLQNIQASKRKLIFFRRIMWSEREKLNELLRTPNTFIRDSTKRYLRDTYDHTIQIMDMIDSYREITASLMDIYLSSVSNRMNNIMKVLTIISTIFIPLTFIVGLYGMNFSYVDPVTGKLLPWNMPELHSPYGYVVVCITMVIIALVLVYFFYRKGWIEFRGKR